MNSNPYKLMYFDRNINGNKDDKFLDRDYCALCTERRNFFLVENSNIKCWIFYNSFFNFVFLNFYAKPRWLKVGITVIRSLHSDWEMRNDCGNNQLILEIRDVEMSKILVGKSGGVLRTLWVNVDFCKIGNSKN